MIFHLKLKKKTWQTFDLRQFVVNVHNFIFISIADGNEIVYIANEMKSDKLKCCKKEKKKILRSIFFSFHLIILSFQCICLSVMSILFA